MRRAFFSNRRGLIGAAIFLLVAGFALAQATTPGRISSRVMDLGDVLRIYLSQGLASVVQLPFPITEVKLGNPDDVFVQVSKTLPSELTVVLRKNGARPTNLVVRCGSRTFVFDLIPSHSTHQDLVRISGSYGGPESEGLGATLIDSSRRATGESTSRSSGDDRVLIDSSQAGPVSPASPNRKSPRPGRGGKP
jgi:hypothetical protein